MVSTEDIREAFRKLRDARSALYNISMAELEAKKILKIRESDLLLSGAIIGKNAETRDAQLAEGCKEERARLEEIQAKKAKAQLQNDLAIMETDELQWQIRNDQAIAGLTGLA